RQQRVVHAKRPKQKILKDASKGLTFNLFGDDTKQVIVGVAIVEFRARSEEWRAFERDSAQLLQGPHLVRVMVEARRNVRRGGVVIKAAPHLEELTNGDVVTVGNVSNILRDRIVEAEFPFL